jgi:DNA-binding NtrC family response regulator
MRPILIGDWDRERANRILSLFIADLEVEVVESPPEVFSFVQNRHPALVIFPLRWTLPGMTQEKSIGFNLIRSLEDLPFRPKLILFDDRLHSLTNPEYCFPFLKGAVSLLDENDPGFLNELKKKAIESVAWQPKMGKERRRVSFEEFGLVGESKAMRSMREFIRNAAYLSTLPVLLSGPSGTGKEVMAQAIQRLDQKRAAAPFIVVNCSAISGMLAESEFFGHKRGAFTGADRDRPGYFRAAQGGVLFLDEISELDLKLQPKLLRVLQEGRVLPVGYEIEQAVDVRVIAATNKDLTALVSQGGFRMDLYQRLNVLSFSLPELKRRKEDIQSLVGFFIKKYQNCYRGRIEGVHPRVFDLLQTLDFEGNVRELENIVRKTLFKKSSGEIIEMGDLPSELLKQAVSPESAGRDEIVEAYLFEKLKKGASFSEVMAWCEKVILKRALDETSGSRSKMAGLLKMTLRTLFNKMHRYYPDRLEKRKTPRPLSNDPLPIRVELAPDAKDRAPFVKEIFPRSHRQEPSDPEAGLSETASAL